MFGGEDADSLDVAGFFLVARWSAPRAAFLLDSWDFTRKIRPRLLSTYSLVNRGYRHFSSSTKSMQPNTHKTLTLSQPTSKKRRNNNHFCNNLSTTGLVCKKSQQNGGALRVPLICASSWARRIELFEPRIAKRILLPKPVARIYEAAAALEASLSD